MKIKRSDNRLFIEKTDGTIDWTIECIKTDEILSFGKSIMISQGINTTYTLYIETQYGKRQLFFQNEKERDIVYDYIYREVVGYEFVDELYNNEDKEE